MFKDKRKISFTLMSVARIRQIYDFRAEKRKKNCWFYLKFNKSSKTHEVLPKVSS